MMLNVVNDHSINFNLWSANSTFIFEVHLKSRLFLTIESGNPPSSIRSALKEHCSSSLSLASFCFAALCASDLKLSNFKEKGKDHGAEIKP